jgi:hypothetical protein
MMIDSGLFMSRIGISTGVIITIALHKTAAALGELYTESRFHQRELNLTTD